MRIIKALLGVWAELDRTQLPRDDGEVEQLLVVAETVGMILSGDIYCSRDIRGPRAILDAIMCHTGMMRIDRSRSLHSVDTHCRYRSRLIRLLFLFGFIHRFLQLFLQIM